ncbi:MAG: barstar family protein [Planctomycetaceae bacterium]
MMSWYQLMADPKSYQDADPKALVVRLPLKLRSKQKVLLTLAQRLHFPRYFGKNWDALEELMRDLNWLEAKRIVLVHEGFPLGAGDGRLIYLQILQSVQGFWKEADEPKEWVIIFPKSAEGALEAAMEALEE